MHGSRTERTLLSDLLQGKSIVRVSTTLEDEGDAALAAGGWSDALKAYDQCDGGNPQLDEKRGWCHGNLEAWPEAHSLLAPHRYLLSSAGLAMLAIASVGGWAARYRMSDATQTMFSQILSEALDFEIPALRAYEAAFWFRNYKAPLEPLLALAKQSVLLYPEVPYFRLKVAEYANRLGENGPEVLTQLLAGLNERSTTEYLWACSSAARASQRWEEGIECLNRAIEATSRHGDAARDAAMHMRLSRAELMLLAGHRVESINEYLDLERLEEPLDASAMLAARRALLAVAATDGEPKEIQARISNWLEAALPYLPRGSYGDVVEGEHGPIYFFDGEMSSFCAGHSLVPHRDRLIENASERDRGLLRFLFAQYDREQSDDYDKNLYVESILKASEETDSIVIQGSLAEALASKKRPAWRASGATWSRYEHARLSQNALPLASEPLDPDDLPTDTAIELYAKGMREEFETMAPSEHLAEIFGTLRDVLIERKLYRSFKNLADLVALDSNDVAKVFDAALAAHYCGDKRDAISGYREVLQLDRTHYQALFNILLLCSTPKEAPDVVFAEKLVATFPTHEPEKNKELLERLEHARKASQDPDEAARSVIGAEIGRYPALMTSLINASKVPFYDAVTLLTLMRICEPEVGDLVLSPFIAMHKLFSPTGVHRQNLFRLLQSGLVAIAGDTPLNAFRVDGARVSGYYFERIRWRMSPATISLTQSIPELCSKKVWPAEWARAAPQLAKSIAAEECIQYLFHIAEDRSWPAPDDSEKVAALAKLLIEHVSVSEAFYLIYLAAMSASDNKQRYPVSAQQASNVVVLRTSQKLSRYLVDPWPLKQFSRNKSIPRSEMSFVLHDDLLRVGERAFSERVGALPYPNSRKRRAIG